MFVAGFSSAVGKEDYAERTCGFFVWGEKGGLEQLYFFELYLLHEKMSNTPRCQIRLLMLGSTSD